MHKLTAALTHTPRSVWTCAVLAAMLAAAACVPLPIGNPYRPRTAEAAAQQTDAEKAARASGFAADTAADVADVVGIPLANPIVAALERVFEGYALEMQRQIAGIEAKQQPAPGDWNWAIVLAMLAGGSNLFSFYKGQQRHTTSPTPTAPKTA